MPKGVAYAPDWLREVTLKATGGDMRARMEYAGMLDLRLAPPPICDEMARERAQYLRARRGIDDNDVFIADAQLGELRQSKEARRALIELAADSQYPSRVRRRALEGFGELVRDYGHPASGPEHWKRRSSPTARERKLLLGLLVGKDAIVR